MRKLVMAGSVRLFPIAVVALSVVLMVGNAGLAQDGLTSSGEQAPTEWIIGGTKVQAEFVRLTDDGVVLRRKSDLKEAEVPLSRLDFQSQLWALKLGKPEAFSKPLPKADTGIVEVGPIEKLDVESLRTSPFTPNMTLEQFARTLESEVKRGNLLVFWHAVPPKMQDEAEDVILQVLELAKPYLQQMHRLVDSLATIAREKKKFVLAHPQIASQPELQEPLEAVWPALAKFLTVVSDDALWDESNFQKGKVREWLIQVVATIGPAFKELDTAMEESGMEQWLLRGQASLPDRSAPRSTDSMTSFVTAMKQAHFTVVQESATSGIMQVGLEGGDVPPLQQEMVKVDGFWTSKEMVDNWDRMLGEVKGALAKADRNQLAMVNFLLGGIVGQVEQMANAKTQSEFNAAVQALMEVAGQAPGMAGLTPGGPGAQAGRGGQPGRPGQPGFGGGRPGQPGGFGGGAAAGGRPGQPGFGGGGPGGGRPGQPGFGGGAPGGGQRPGRPGLGGAPSGGGGGQRPGQPGFGGGGTGGSSD